VRPPTELDVDATARVIFESVWHTRTRLAADKSSKGRPPRLLVLVGAELYLALGTRAEVADGTGPWSFRDPLLRVIDAEVHAVEPPLVESFISWRIVTDTGVRG
jgi:hypothetical protein